MTAQRRRRNRPKASRTPDPTTAVETTESPEPGTPPAGAGSTRPKTGARKPGDRHHGPRDSGMRDLAGTGASQVGISRALRARDVNRPTDDDMAEAEQEMTIIRRHWKPDSGH